MKATTTSRLVAAALLAFPIGAVAQSTSSHVSEIDSAELTMTGTTDLQSLINGLPTLPRLGENMVRYSAIPVRGITATNVTGEVLADTNALLGQGDPAEAVLFTDRVRLNFDTSFTGSDVLRTRVRASGGYNENPAENLFNSDSSWFGSAGFQGNVAHQNGPLSIAAGFSYDGTFYDKRIPRDGNERYIQDVEFALGGSYQFRPWASLDTFFRGYWGGNRDIGRGFTHGGVNFNNYFYWDWDTDLNYRFDGRPLGDPGVGWTTSFTWAGVHNDEESQYDNHYKWLLQEIRYIWQQERAVFIEGGYGWRWIDDLGEADSNGWRIGAGVRGKLNDQVRGELAVGYERRDYDASGLNEDREDGVYVRGALTAQPVDSVSIGAYGDYGILTFNDINFNTIDPMGVRAGLRTVYSWTNTTRFIGDMNWTTYKNSDVIIPNPDDDHFVRWAGGLGVEHDLNERWTLGLDGSLIHLDNEFESDTAFVGTLRTRFRF